MIKFIMAGAVLFGIASASMMPTAAAAAEWPAPVLQTQPEQPLTFVQYRRGYGGRGYYRRGYYRGGGGGGVAAGLAGLAAGAIIGGVIASQARSGYRGGDAVAYCESRFRSYNPATGTYLGYDGLRHRCP
jgi:hypothetical protein